MRCFAHCFICSKKSESSLERTSRGFTQCESSKHKIDQIKRKIKIKEDLTDEQRKRLIEIADKCPVHKTWEGRPEILTEEISV
ncbi:MAG: hypothetical protein AAF600_00470 [Bacteroidota bacterium]